MKLGATPKQIAILGGLVVVALFLQFSGGGDGDRPKSDGKRGASPVATPLPVSGSAGPRAVTPVAAKNAAAPRPNSRNRTSLEYKPVLRPRRVEDRVDPTTIDPTLRTDILAKLGTIQIQGGSRPLFDFGTAPPPVVKAPDPGKIKVTPGAVKPPPVVIAPVKPPSGPVTPVKPQAPPIPLKFYGFTSARAGLKRAFFLEGEDVYVANEGDIVKKRYKVVRVNLNSVVMEDTEYKQQQTLPLTEQSQ